MGMIGAAFGLGMVVGPFMGGVLAGDGNNFLLPCLAAAFMSLLAIVAGLLFLPESLPAEKRAEHAAHHATQPKQSLLAMLKSTGNTLLVSTYFLHNTCISSVSWQSAGLGCERSWLCVWRARSGNGHVARQIYRQIVAAFW
jgi:MFS family permease